MAAIATLWHLSRALDWATVRLECHTRHPITRWTLPSDVQKFTSVLVSTPNCFILLITHMVLDLIGGLIDQYSGLIGLIDGLDSLIGVISGHISG